MSLRFENKDIFMILKNLEELSELKSITKMAPELIRILINVKDNLKSHYVQEKKEQESAMFIIKTKVTDLKKLNAK